MRRLLGKIRNAVVRLLVIRDGQQALALRVLKRDFIHAESLSLVSNTGIPPLIYFLTGCKVLRNFSRLIALGSRIRASFLHLRDLGALLMLRLLVLTLLQQKVHRIYVAIMGKLCAIWRIFRC